MWLPRIWLVVLLAMLVGCSSTSRVVRVFPKGLPKVPHTPSTGMVEGRECGSGSFLFLRFGRTPSLIAAVEEALESAGGDFNGLADVTATFESESWILFGYNCVTVRGRPVHVGVKDKPEWMVPADNVPEGTGEADWVF